MGSDPDVADRTRTEAAIDKALRNSTRAP